MKTPLLFKLALLLAVALRLIKASKKSISAKKSYFLLPKNSVPLPLSATLDEFGFKKIYREQTRPHLPNLPTLEHAMLHVVYKWHIHFKKGGIYRFLWHENALILAFKEVLELLNEEILLNYYYEILVDVCGYSSKEFYPQESLFPSPEIHGIAIEEFNRRVNPEDLILKTLQYVSKGH